MPQAIRVEDLTLSFRHHPAVHRLHCEFPAGSLTAVVGPNGAGKSSLLQALAGLLRPTGGSVTPPRIGSAAVAYLPQQAHADRGFPLRVLDVVMLGHWPQLGLFQGASAVHKQQARAALEAVRLVGFENRLIAELSVGQFQRVLFARLMLQDAALILLDEPFAAIDSRTTADLLAVVARWHTEQRTVIVALHDLAQVRAHFPSTLLIARERIAHGPTAQVLSPEHLERARRMAECWDESAPRCRDEHVAFAAAQATPQSRLAA